MRYGYQYSSDGSLSGITKDGELLYTYDYDTLGRLIHSSMLEDGKMVLYTDHQYDTSDRILSQSWQIGTDGFQETYSYNDKDGTLAMMTTAGDTLSFAYDGLKRLVNDSVTREAITRKQERTFLEFVKNDKHFCKYYDGIYVLFKTGLRISEFVGLTIQDVGLKNRKLNVDHQL